MGLFDRFKRGESEADDEAEDEEDFDRDEVEDSAAVDAEDDAEDSDDAEYGSDDDDSEEDDAEDSDDVEHGGDDDDDSEEDAENFDFDGEDGDNDDEYDDDDDEDEDDSRSGRLAALAGLIPKGRPRLIAAAAGVFIVAGVLTGVTVGTFMGGDDEPSAKTARPGTISLVLPVGGLTASGGGLNAIGVGAGSETAAFGTGAAGTLNASDTMAASPGLPTASEEPSFLNPKQENIDAEGLNAFAVPGGQTQRSGTDIIADVTGKRAFNAVADRNTGGALQLQPEEALLESVQGGIMVPKIEGRRSALTAYARPSSPPAGRPRVAIVVIGLGHSRTSAEAAIKKLPPEMSLSFDIYAANLQSWVREAWKSGHEVLISLPMESGKFPNEDAGPMALSTDYSVKSNLRRLNSIMGRAKGYIGVQTAMGSAFMADEDRIKPVLETIKQRGLMIFESTKDPGSLVPRLATEMGVPRAFVNVELDVNPSHAAVVQRLADLEAIARQRGVAVGITRALPSALERITEWAGQAEQKGISLVPISRIANRGSGKT